MNRTTLPWLRGCVREALRWCWCRAMHRDLQPTNVPGALVCGCCGVWHDNADALRGTQRNATRGHA